MYEVGGKIEGLGFGRELKLGLWMGKDAAWMGKDPSIHMDEVGPEQIVAGALRMQHNFSGGDGCVSDRSPSNLVLVKENGWFKFQERVCNFLHYRVDIFRPPISQVSFIPNLLVFPELIPKKRGRCVN